MVQNTSVQAYWNIEEDLGERQALVYNTIKNSPRSLTNTEIAKILNIPINTVTPRTNELVMQKLVEEKEKRKCDVTGRLAITWGIGNDQPKKECLTHTQYSNVIKKVNKMNTFQKVKLQKYLEEINKRGNINDRRYENV